MQGSSKFKSRSTLSKVPQVLLLFWLIKTFVAIIGQSTTDFLHQDYKISFIELIGYFSVFMSIIFVVQIRANRYISWLYWSLTILISIFGTLISNYLRQSLSIETSSLCLAVGASFIFLIWYISDYEITTDDISEKKQEIFYWLATLMFFALGVSISDLMSEWYDLGYFMAFIVFFSLTAIIIICYYAFEWNGTLCFWVAFFLTGSLADALGNLFTSFSIYGGLGISKIMITILFSLLIVAGIFFSSSVDSCDRIAMNRRRKQAY